MEIQEIRPLFREDEWRCMRLLHEKPREAPAVRYTAGHMGWKESKLRDTVLSRLIEGGYLSPRTYFFTEQGEAAYQSHRAWWEALVWKMQETGLEREQTLALADQLVCSQAAVPLIQKALEQESYAQMQAERQVGSELIGETDFLGIIRPGSYKVDYCLLAMDEEGYDSEEARISGLTDCFHPEGRVIIEPINSRLELKWTGETAALSGATYHMDGSEYFDAAREGSIQIYFRAIRFEQVAQYRILDGECRLTLHLEYRDGRRQERQVCLELPLSYEWSE